MKFEITEFWYEPIPYSPEIKDYKRLWDSHYSVYRRNQEIHYNKYYHRFPEVLCPEYKVWYWRTIGHWYYRVRYNLWWTHLRKCIYKDKINKLQYAALWIIEPFISSKWWNKWYTIEWEECTFCGYKMSFIDCFDSDWFYFTNGGSRFTGDYTQHWFEGIWTCPRCLTQWEYGDSD